MWFGMTWVTSFPPWAQSRPRHTLRRRHHLALSVCLSVGILFPPRSFLAITFLGWRWLFLTGFLSLLVFTFVLVSAAPGTKRCVHGCSSVSLAQIPLHLSFLAASRTQSFKDDKRQCIPSLIINTLTSARIILPTYTHAANIR